MSKRQTFVISVTAPDVMLSQTDDVDAALEELEQKLRLLIREVGPIEVTVSPRAVGPTEAAVPACRHGVRHAGGVVLACEACRLEILRK